MRRAPFVFGLAGIQGTPSCMTIDAQALYWCDRANGKIVRMLK
jgi:hypothetical protein